MNIDEKIKAEIIYNMHIDYGIKNAIQHDMHKPDKEKHDRQFRWLDTNADRDAANMSRPRIATKKGEMSGEYLSLSYIKERDMSERTRKIYAVYKWNNYDKKYMDRTVPALELHEQLLNDRIVGNFNEITSMLYTSLKYHTLLVCALHYNYKQERDFQNLYLHCVT